MNQPDTTPMLTSDHTIGVILAGGQSSRMGGGDKFLKPVHNTNMLYLVRDRFTTQIQTILLSANEPLERLRFINLPIITDPPILSASQQKNTNPGQPSGPLAGILAAMIWAEKYTNPSTNTKPTHIISIGADTPFFPNQYVSSLLTEANKHSPDTIILAKSHGRYHPIFGLWPVSLRADLQKKLNEGLRKIRAWTDSHNNAAIEYEDITFAGQKIDPFFNVNNPDDFTMLENLLSNVTK